jgi:hypothetical protein
MERPDFLYLGMPGQVAEIRKRSGEVVIVTGKNFLVLEEVEKTGQKHLKPAEIIKSIRTRLGPYLRR